LAEIIQVSGQGGGFKKLFNGDLTIPRV